MPRHTLTLLSLALWASAQTAPTSLTGTWSTKSNTTFTGSGFYDPVKDVFIEPAHTGISYSFTSDGHFEEAYFRAVANPTDPSCASAVLQWQHGTFQQSSSGGLLLTPIAIDGRQLTSNPCNSYKTTYYRYNQTETFKSYELLIDPYHKIPRLNLYRFDGSPMPPMYIASTTPDMNPTTTLHPKATASATQKPSRLMRRSNALADEYDADAASMSRQSPMMLSATLVEPDVIWWLGLGLSGFGGLLYLCFGAS